LTPLRKQMIEAMQLRGFSLRTHEKELDSHLLEAPRKREPERARLCPYPGLRATPTRGNGGQNGPIGKIRGSDRTSATGLPPMLYRVRLWGSRES